MTDNDLKKIRTVIQEELEPATERLDAITAELHHVHKLTNATYDTVKLNKGAANCR